MTGVLPSRDTIYAVSTGPGRSAIAVIRISGPACRFVARTICGGVPLPRRASLRRLRHPESRSVLDEALVLFFEGPHSDTGEDVLELHVHGGRATVSAVLAALAMLPGLRLAEPGGFARRALANGRKDLLQLEALGDLIAAETEAQRRQAMEGGGSLLRGRAESWRGQLIDLLAEIEAEIDFSDEGDVQRGFDSLSQQTMDLLIADMTRVLDQAKRGERIREGFRVVLIGAPNVGKSSLLNALAGRDVAIVSEHAGTTRDRVEVFLDLGGIPVIITDTAGLRLSTDPVEKEGIRRSLRSAEEADLILKVVADDIVGSDAIACPEGVAMSYVWAKCDIASVGALSGDVLAVSAKTGEGIKALLEYIEHQAALVLTDREPAVVTRQRHRLAIAEGRDALLRATVQVYPELRAEEIRRCITALEMLLGRIGVENVLDAVFSRFCIGK